MRSARDNHHGQEVKALLDAGYRVTVITGSHDSRSAVELKKEIKDQVVEIVTKELNLTEEEFLTFMGDVYQIKTEVEDFVRQF